MVQEKSLFIWKPHDSHTSYADLLSATCESEKICCFWIIFQLNCIYRRAMTHMHSHQNSLIRDALTNSWKSTWYRMQRVIIAIKAAMHFICKLKCTIILIHDQLSDAHLRHMNHFMSSNSKWNTNNNIICKLKKNVHLREWHSLAFRLLVVNCLTRSFCSEKNENKIFFF